MVKHCNTGLFVPSFDIFSLAGLGTASIKFSLKRRVIRSDMVRYTTTTYVITSDQMVLQYANCSFRQSSFSIQLAPALKTIFCGFEASYLGQTGLF